MTQNTLPQIFLSYSTANRHLAGQFKDSLETMGFDVFLAHSTLVASTEWRSKIKEELEDREVFIVLLTPEAKESDWVDQEIGIAIALKKTIIPIQAPTRVYGFAADYHAVVLGEQQDVWEVLRQVVRGIAAKFPTQLDPFRKGLIERLCKSTSFEEAKNSLRILQSIPPDLTIDERRTIYQASQRNGQIGGYNEVKRFVEDLEREFGRRPA